MSKVLMIESCSECYAAWGLPHERPYCVKDYQHRFCPKDGIPDWCPLPDLPERKGEMDYLAAGYNKCLDDILEGEE